MTLAKGRNIVDWIRIRQVPACGRRAFLRAFWVLAVAAVFIGCSSQGSAEPELTMDLALDPAPPVVGETRVSLKMTGAGGSPVEGAEVRVEGNMNHAGMKPSFADLKEVEPGRYEGTLDFTMGGDWFLLITAKTADGKTVEQKIDVPGVKPK